MCTGQLHFGRRWRLLDEFVEDRAPICVRNCLQVTNESSALEFWMERRTSTVRRRHLDLLPPERGAGVDQRRDDEDDRWCVVFEQDWQCGVVHRCLTVIEGDQGGERGCRAVADDDCVGLVFAEQRAMFGQPCDLSLERLWFVDAVKCEDGQLSVREEALADGCSNSCHHTVDCRSQQLHGTLSLESAHRRAVSCRTEASPPRPSGHLGGSPHDELNATYSPPKPGRGSLLSQGRRPGMSWRTSMQSKRWRESSLSILARRRAGSDPFEERAQFVDLDSGHIATTEYVPDEPSGEHVVICPSIMADFLHNLRREVVLSRWLCARGCHVVRFQYLGTGNSGGDDALNTLDQMALDAVAVADHLIGSGDVSTTWLGTRLGAFPAVRAAAERGDDRVVLVDPVLAGKTFVKEGFRARLATNAKDGGDTITIAELKKMLQDAGEVDILGQTLTLPMYEQLLSADLASNLGTIGSSLLVQLGGDQMKKGLSSLASELRSSGADVTTMVIEDSLGWWFAESEALPDDDLIARLGGWIAGGITSDAPGVQR